MTWLPKETWTYHCETCVKLWLFTFCSVHYNKSTCQTVNRADARRFIAWTESAAWIPWICCNLINYNSWSVIHCHDSFDMVWVDLTTRLIILIVRNTTYKCRPGGTKNRLSGVCLHDFQVVRCRVSWYLWLLLLESISMISQRSENPGIRASSGFWGCRIFHTKKQLLFSKMTESHFR